MFFKRSKTEEKLKAAFAGESKQTDVTYISLKKLTKGTTMLLLSSDRPLKVKLVMHTVIWSFLKKLVILQQANQLGTIVGLKVIAGETHEYTDMYPGMVKTARDEGFDEIADWFETLAKAEKSHACFKELLMKWLNFYYLGSLLP